MKSVFALRAMVFMLFVAIPCLASDMDFDGVPNSIDVCNNTPDGVAVDSQGRPLGDIDLDCDTDLEDYALFQQGFTGPMMNEQIVLIPSGTFEMGDHHGDGGFGTLPVHTVYVSAFFMDVFETTNEQFIHFLNAQLEEEIIEVEGGRVFQVAGHFRYCHTVQSSMTPCHTNWDGQIFFVTPGKSEHPVTAVTWYGAAAYANWRSELENLEPCYDLENWTCDFQADGYRLPTEAEWEFAARGGMHDPYRRYPWGDDLEGSKANFSFSGDPYETQDHPQTTPVGYYDGNQQPEGTDMANGYGLYDMAGNVWEWCNDWFHIDYYSSSPSSNPTGPVFGNQRVIRGGSWLDNDIATCAWRAFSNPDQGPGNYGIRLVRATSCTDDADCDDGLFCNGSETCSEGSCHEGLPPCSQEECDEEYDFCPGEDFRLTYGPDMITGSSNDDYFDANQDLSTPPNQLDTLNNTDFLDGGEGEDLLYAVLSNNVTPAKMANIEIIHYTAVEPVTLTATQATEIREITNLASTANSVIGALIRAPEALNVLNTQHSTTVHVVSNSTYPNLTGTDDILDVTVEGLTNSSSTVTIQPTVSGSGYETINLHSDGALANTLRLNDGNGNSLETMNFSGPADLELRILPATVTTFNGENATGNLTFNIDSIYATVTGGSGDDTFQFSGLYEAGTTVVDGGDGVDELQANSAQVTGTTTPVSNVTNIETIGVANTLTGNLDVTHFGASHATLHSGSGTQTITMPTGGKLTFAGTTDTTGNVTVTAKTDTGTDTLDVIFDVSAGPLAGDNLVANTFEYVNLDVWQNSSVNAIELSGYPGVVETLTVTGSGNLSVPWLAAEKVDASAATGALTLTGKRTGCTIIGGSANDTLTAGTPGNNQHLFGNDGNDVLTKTAGDGSLDGGPGSDILMPGYGNVVMTGGTGSDTFIIDGTSSSGTGSHSITDFETGDLFKYDISVIEGLSTINELVDTSRNFAAPGDGTYVTMSYDGQTVAGADIVGIIGDYTGASDVLSRKTEWTVTFAVVLGWNDAILIAYSEGPNVHIAVAKLGGNSSNSDSVDEIIDITVLENTSLDDLDSSDFTSQA